MSEFILTFADSHPFLSCLVIIVGCEIITAPIKYAFKAYNRSLRAKNIALHGWPQAPIDADGDVVHPKAE